jgi:hypothetical protein
MKRYGQCKREERGFKKTTKTERKQEKVFAGPSRAMRRKLVCAAVLH